ncbi:MAG: agmatine deiminase family protein [Myxococcota bacterium]
MTDPSPKRLGYRMPAEWEPHRTVWLAWPSAADLWRDNLAPAQEEVTALCEEIADRDENGRARGERISMLVPTDAARHEAERHLRGLPVDFHAIPFGDIWLRDIAPLFLTGSGPACARFAFNGWGGKYNLDHDNDVAVRIAQAAGLTTFVSPVVLEGGSIELDGEGTCLTTKQCLLNPNRNPTLTAEAVETAIKDNLGVERTLWLNEGLVNDHTDGHIDTLARFTAPGKVLCMRSWRDDDPNKPVLAEIERDLTAMVDAKGRALNVNVIPSPGVVRDEDGRVMPASYLNFYIANTTVVVPTYGSDVDGAAVDAIAEHFPGRRVIGCRALAILSGGGAFHCISQQQPA